MIFNKVFIVIAALLILMVVYGLTLPENTFYPGGNIEINPYSWVTEYTTPNDPAVIQQANVILDQQNGYLSITDVNDLQLWVASNIKYKTEEPEFPNQTLSDRNGNCYNMCNLLYSMILYENQNFPIPTYMLLMDIEIDGEEYRHSVILSVFSDGIIISDPTLGNSHVGRISSFSEPEEAIEKLKEDTIIDDCSVTHAVSFDEYQEFSTNQEFYDFALGKMEVSH